MTDIGTTPRKAFTDLQRLKIFERAGGRCWLCERKIQVGEKWEVEHRRALSMLGTNDDDNLAPAHLACHATKSKREATDRAKAKRMKIKHFGGKKPSRFPKPPAGYNYWTRRIEQ